MKLHNSSSIQYGNKQFCSTNGYYITFIMKEEIQAVHKTQACSTIYQEDSSRHPCRKLQQKGRGLEKANCF